MQTRSPRRARLPWIAVAALVVGLCGPAWAQTLPQTTPRAEPPAPPAAATLAPAQARQALDVLKDDKRRAELVTTLEAIAAAGGSPAPPAGKATDTPSPAQPTTKLPLEPDSLGAELISQVSIALSDAGAELVASVEQVNDLPLLWRWLYGQLNDADARALILDGAWKLLVVVCAGLGLERAGVLLLRQMRAAVSRGAQTKPAPPPPPDVPEPEPDDASAVQESGERARSARARRLTGALGSLRRLPYLLGRLILDVVPIALFGVLADILLGTRLGMPASTRGTILVVVQGYLTARLILAVTELLVSPARSSQRLLHVSDWAAEFLTRWTRRVTIVAITGFAVAGVGLQYGMYRTAYETLLKLFALVVHVCVVVAILQAREPIARRIRARHSARGAWAALLNRLADIWHLIAIFYVMALWLVWAVELRNGYVRLIHFFIVTAGVMITARLTAIVLLGGLDKTRTLPALATRLPGFEARAVFYYPFLRAIVMGLIGLATGFALLEAWGFGIIGWFQESGLGGRALSAAILIAAAMFLAVVVWEGVNAAIELQLRQLGRSAQLARAARLRTLLPMFRTVLLVTIVLVVVLTSLSELGLNIAPLLAGAGVIGIAVGFGSQKLVQDLITGLFLLLENAMQVGDVVTLGGLSGTVEALSIRTIRLRALDGSIHIIPFSAVTTVTNQTRDYSYALLDVSVGLNETPERVTTVVKEAADAMRKEPRWANLILEPLDVMGVEKFVDLAWVMRVRMKTQPASRWAVGRELNRRIKEAFDALGIESPFTSHRALSDTPPTEEETHDKVDARAAE